MATEAYLGFELLSASMDAGGVVGGERSTTVRSGTGNYSYALNTDGSRAYVQNSHYANSGSVGSYITAGLAVRVDDYSGFDGSETNIYIYGGTTGTEHFSLCYWVHLHQ